MYPLYTGRGFACAATHFRVGCVDEVALLADRARCLSSNSGALPLPTISSLRSDVFIPISTISPPEVFSAEMPLPAGLVAMSREVSKVVKLSFPVRAYDFYACFV